MEFKVYITNLGKYNEGYLVGKWLSLPCDDIEEELKSIGVSDEPGENGNYYEEYFITDYENDIGYSVGEYESLTRLNELVERAEDVANDNGGADIIGAWLEAYSNDLEEALDDIEAGRVTFLGDIDEEDYGREMVQCAVDRNTWKYLESIEYYIDFERLGKSYLEDYTNTSYGYILSC